MVAGGVLPGPLALTGVCAGLTLFDDGCEPDNVGDDDVSEVDSKVGGIGGGGGGGGGDGDAGGVQTGGGE